MNKRLCMCGIILIAAYTVATFWICAAPKETKIELPEEIEIIAYDVQYTSAPEIEVEEIPEEVLNKPASEPEWGFDFDYICRVVAAESRGEPYEGQVAVARCIWNTAIYKGITMEQVVNMSNRYADPVSIDLVTDELRDACRDAFLGINLPTEEPIEYFYSGDWSQWHESALEYVMTIGGHKFFKEK